MIVTLLVEARPVAVNEDPLEYGVHHVFNLILVFLELHRETRLIRKNVTRLIIIKIAL